MLSSNKVSRKCRDVDILPSSTHQRLNRHRAVHQADAGVGGVAVYAGVGQGSILIATVTHASSISTQVLFPNYEGNPWRQDPPRERPKEAF